ncbi:unnamed protein product [Cochlearia groenlandica]
MAHTNLIFFTLFFLSLSLSSFSHSKSFTVELIHRDSPHSPLYNPLETVSPPLSSARSLALAVSTTTNAAKPISNPV